MAHLHPNDCSSLLGRPRPNGGSRTQPTPHRSGGIDRDQPRRPRYYKCYRRPPARPPPPPSSSSSSPPGQASGKATYGILYLVERAHPFAAGKPPGKATHCVLHLVERAATTLLLFTFLLAFAAFSSPSVGP